MGHNGKTHILRNESWMNLPVFAGLTPAQLAPRCTKY